MKRTPGSELKTLRTTNSKLRKKLKVPQEKKVTQKVMAEHMGMKEDAYGSHERRKWLHRRVQLMYRGLLYELKNEL